MQLHQDARSLDLLKADLPKADLPGAQTTGNPAHGSQGTVGQSWRYAGAFTGVAAVASAGIVLPLTGESAIAYSTPAEAGVPQRQAAAIDRAATDKRAGRGEPLAPQVTQANGARFSESDQSSAMGRTGRSAQGGLAARITDSASQTPLIAMGEDGNWTLAYSSGVNSGAGQQSQAVIAQLAQQSAQSARARQNCTGGECQRLAYIGAQLPQAQQRVQALQQSIAEFEALHGQQDMAAYQEVLTSRIAEITQQSTQLQTNLEQTRRDMTQLQMRLATVKADTGMAERILSQNDAYQATWVRLEQAERNLLEEFSKVDLDATRLNEIYADYRYQQQQLQRASQEALGGYLTAPDTVAPSFVYQAPAALDIMQDLVITTHQYQVQQLRQGTIDKIEQRLQSRQQLLVESLGEYEQLQRELTMAQESVAQYQREREGTGTHSQIANQGQPALAPSSAMAQAQTLASRLPEGSVAKTVLGVVIVAGAIATAAAARQRSKKATYIPEAAVPDFRPTVDSAAIGIFRAEPIRVESFEVTSFEADRTPAWVGAARHQRQSPAEALPTELLQPTEQSAQVIRAYAAAQTDTVEDDLTVEIMVRELDEILNQATTEAEFTGEVDTQPVAPVQLPLQEIDLFAEHAVRWVLKDLGLDAPADRQALAEHVRAA